jgi:hypothetical protein
MVEAVGVRWFWGLTCDFWAENAKNKWDVGRFVASPSAFSPGFGRAKSVSWIGREQRRGGTYGLKGSTGCGEWTSSGSFAALRMTAETGNDKGKDGQWLGCCWVEKRISPLRCSQKREQLRSK